MQLTEQQLAVRDSTAKNIVVRAYAGATKTTTLIEYAKHRPEDKFLYIAYNTSVRDEAERRFPKNVRCATSHQVAYPTFGRPYANKLGNPKPLDISQMFGWDFQSSAAVLQTVTNFICSADSEIDEAHALAAGVAPEKTGKAIDAARRVWESMLDRASHTLPTPHDAYLKAYALTNPRLLAFDTLLLDEWQDANPALQSIVMKQRCGKVYVGDDYQAIYGWRGAINALGEVEADEQYRLTTSFRFGDGIASLASRLLADWFGETIPLRGAGAQPTRWQVDRNAPHTVLARTNGALFNAAISLLGHPLGIAFNGGIKGYRIDAILEAQQFFAGNVGVVRDRVMQSLGTWDAFRNYATETEDNEYKSLIHLVETHKDALPSLIARITKEADTQRGGITLSTAHKAKGLEWDSVILLDDFRRLEATADPKTGDLREPDPQELNLLYVAFTRARQCLEVHPEVNGWLERRKHFDLLELMAGQAPKPQSSAPEVAMRPTTTTPQTATVTAGMLAWVRDNPAKAMPWIARVRASVAAGEALSVPDRMLLGKLLGELSGSATDRRPDASRV